MPDRRASQIGQLRRSTATLRKSGLRHPSQALGADVIQGDLADYSITDLLQFLGQLRKEGQLIIEQDRPLPRSAGIYFHDGVIIHAYTTMVEGPEAVFQLLRWTRGRFVFLGSARPERETVAGELSNLLLEGSRRLDDWHALIGRLPELTTVVHQQRDARLIGSELMPVRAWRVWDQVDGRHALGDLIDASLHGPDVTAACLVQLWEAALIVDHCATDYLAEIIVQRLGSEYRSGKPHPPGHLARHLLRLCDGRRSLAAFRQDLACSEHELVTSVRELLVHRWVAPRRGVDLVRRFIV